MDKQLDIKPKVVIEKEVNKEKEYKLIGKMLLKKGITMFKFNIATNELSKLETQKKVSIGLDKTAKKEIKATHDQDCIYIQSLNMNNARKKADKISLKLKKENDRRENNNK